MKLATLDVSLPALLLVLGACSHPSGVSARDAADANDTGQSVAAKNANERDVLARLPHLPSGARQQIGDLAVTAASPYAAASGRTCRSLEVTTNNHQPSHRLACSNGGAWFFVPEVFVGAAAE